METYEELDRSQYTGIISYDTGLLLYVCDDAHSIITYVHSSIDTEVVIYAHVVFTINY